MAAVYRALRTGAGGDADRPLVFISGSPRFFKRTLEAKLDLDGIVHDGVTLKPFKVIAWNARFEPWKISSNLEEQVGYKLNALLQGRMEMPPGVSPERPGPVVGAHLRLELGEVLLPAGLLRLQGGGLLAGRRIR